MLLTSTISDIIAAQEESLVNRDSGLKRKELVNLPDLATHALIISGIRRCGKSTLLLQLMKKRYPDALYLNFEDPRLSAFDGNDFQRLDEIIKAAEKEVLLFDEIQVVDQWEKYLRQKLDEGYKIVVTGSNASLLSRELGTKLTGRHITTELFPFSYHEFNLFNKSKPSTESLQNYLISGGFPGYLKAKTPEILIQLFDDILIRDIAVRHGIRDVKTLQQLSIYLISNVGKLITANRLKQPFQIGATSTVMEYLSHLEDTYLFSFIPKFSYSARKQLVNPRKVYAIDTGLVGALSGSFSEDTGRKFENLVYLHLRRKYKDIFYFSEKGECDFIVFDKGKLSEIVQVCSELNQDNLDRELNGLYEALDFFKAKTGKIVTLNQTDHFKKGNKTAQVIPAYLFMK